MDARAFSAASATWVQDHSRFPCPGLFRLRNFYGEKFKKSNRMVLHLSLPLLPGSLSTARSTCCTGVEPFFANSSKSGMGAGLCHSESARMEARTISGSVEESALRKVGSASPEGA